MASLLGLVAGLATFVLWLSIVGNPHVVETVIGLILALVAGIWTYAKVKHFTATPNGSKGRR
jgi:uncharacterized membrane protein YqjE